jgi:hypothetical protein
LLFSSSAWASCVIIRSSKDVRASVDAGVKGVCGAPSCRLGAPTTSSAIDVVKSTIGCGPVLSTLFESDGNRPLAEKPASMFLAVNAFPRTGLNKEVKCSLTIVLMPPRSSRSNCSREATFSGAKTATWQGCSL